MSGAGAAGRNIQTGAQSGGGWRALPDMVVVVTAAAATGLLFGRAFPTPLVLAVTCTAAVVSALGVMVGHRFIALGRAPGGFTVAVRLAMVAGSLALAFVLASHGALALLAVTLPAPPTPGVLVVPAAFAWLGAWLGAELALRALPGHTLVVLLPTAPAWVYAAFLGPPGHLDRVAAAVVAGCGVIQLVRGASWTSAHTCGRTRRRFGPMGDGRWARILALATVGLVVAGIAPTIAPLRRRAEPDARAHLPYAALPLAAVNPLDWVGAWLTDPDRVLFRARTTVEVKHWRLAVLERFDGEQWLPPATYTRAGLGVPTTVGPRARGRVAQAVTIEGLRGPFLPSVDRPVRITPPVTGVDIDSGVLVTGRTVQPGLSYQVTSHDRPSLGEVDAACPQPSARPEPPTASTELNEALTELAAAGRCGGSFTAYARQIERRLSTDHRHLAGVPPAGTSVGALRAFLSTDGAGTAVEFAASFALAVRQAGVPSRLVVGFGATAAGDRFYQVRGRDVRVWVDVNLPGLGWVAYHLGLPAAVSSPRLTGPAAGPAVAPPLWQPPPPDPHPIETSGPNRIRHLSTLPWRTFLAAIGVLVAIYLLAVLTVPGGRRWVRRSRGSPRSRVIGAWHEVLDELTGPSRHGSARRELTTATPAKVRALVQQRHTGADAANARLCWLVETALYGEQTPADEEIDHAWRAAGAVCTGLRRRTARPVRVVRWLSPGNLSVRPRWD